MGQLLNERNPVFRQVLICTADTNRAVLEGYCCEKTSVHSRNGTLAKRESTGEVLKGFLRVQAVPFEGPGLALAPILIPGPGFEILLPFRNNGLIVELDYILRRLGDAIEPGVFQCQIYVDALARGVDEFDADQRSDAHFLHLCHITATTLVRSFEASIINASLRTFSIAASRRRSLFYSSNPGLIMVQLVSEIPNHLKEIDAHSSDSPRFSYVFAKFVRTPSG